MFAFLLSIVYTWLVFILYVPMDRKAYLLALLYKISDETLPVKEDIISLLNSDVLWDNFIDVLVSIFLEAQTKTQTILGQQQIQKSIAFVQKIQAMENKDREQDAQDILELDQMLESI